MHCDKTADDFRRKQNRVRFSDTELLLKCHVIEIEQIN